jgi:hypothetical protein
MCASARALIERFTASATPSDSSWPDSSRTLGSPQSTPNGHNRRLRAVSETELCGHCRFDGRTTLLGQ